MQGLAVDAQDARGERLVAVRSRQHARDVPAFDLVERRNRTGLATRRLGGPLDDRAELVVRARPLEREEPRSRAGGLRRDGGAGLLKRLLEGASLPAVVGDDDGTLHASSARRRDRRALKLPG